MRTIPTDGGEAVVGGTRFAAIRLPADKCPRKSDMLSWPALQDTDPTVNSGADKGRRSAIEIPQQQALT
jgi:hypothetical protein